MLLTVSYVLLLALLKAWGAFDERDARPRSARPAKITGRSVSACVETRLGDRLVLAAESGMPTPARVEAYLAQGTCDRLAVLPGRRLALEGKLRAPRPALMPGDFDEASLLAARGVAYVLHARQARVIDARVPWRWRAHAWAERARLSAHRAFRERLSPDDARLLEGLLFGYKGNLDLALQRQVQDAGVMHLLVPSGAKVGFIVWGFAWLVSLAGMPRRWTLAAPVAAGGFYCLMVGSQAPYLRAYGAALAGLAAGLWPSRDAGGLQAIALSALALLLAWPMGLFSAGFQMTYAAAIGLWLAAPRWKPRTGNKWADGGLRVLAISLAVQLALWPVLANVFGRASVAGLLSNVLLVPASGFYMAGGLLLWLVSPFAPTALVAAWLMTWALALFKAVCAGFAAFPGAAVDLLPMGAGGILLWYLACGALFLLPDIRPASRVAGVAVAAWALCTATAWAAGPRLELCFLSDRRGYATWAGLPGGEHILIDAGLAPARLAAALHELGARQVDAIVLTSAAREASRGLRVAEHSPVGRIIRDLKADQRWGSVTLRRHGAESILEFGRFYLSFGEVEGLATLARSEGGPIEFCILRHPAAVAPEKCAPAGIRGAGIEGALWIITDGNHYQIGSASSVRPLRRPVL